MSIASRIATTIRSLARHALRLADFLDGSEAAPEGVGDGPATVQSVEPTPPRNARCGREKKRTERRNEASTRRSAAETPDTASDERDDPSSSRDVQAAMASSRAKPRDRAVERNDRDEALPFNPMSKQVMTTTEAPVPVVDGGPEPSVSQQRISTVGDLPSAEQGVRIAGRVETPERPEASSPIQDAHAKKRAPRARKKRSVCGSEETLKHQPQAEPPKIFEGRNETEQVADNPFYGESGSIDGLMLVQAEGLPRHRGAALTSGEPELLTGAEETLAGPSVTDAMSAMTPAESAANDTRSTFPPAQEQHVVETADDEIAEPSIAPTSPGRQLLDLPEVVPLYGTAVSPDDCDELGDVSSSRVNHPNDSGGCLPQDASSCVDLGVHPAYPGSRRSVESDLVAAFRLAEETLRRSISEVMREVEAEMPWSEVLRIAAEVTGTSSRVDTGDSRNGADSLAAVMRLVQPPADAREMPRPEPPDPARAPTQGPAPVSLLGVPLLPDAATGSSLDAAQRREFEIRRLFRGAVTVGCSGYRRGLLALGLSEAEIDVRLDEMRAQRAREIEQAEQEYYRRMGS